MDDRPHLFCNLSLLFRLLRLAPDYTKFWYLRHSCANYLQCSQHCELIASAKLTKVTAIYKVIYHLFPCILAECVIFCGCFTSCPRVIVLVMYWKQMHCGYWSVGMLRYRYSVTSTATTFICLREIAAYSDDIRKSSRKHLLWVQLLLLLWLLLLLLLRAGKTLVVFFSEKVFRF